MASAVFAMLDKFCLVHFRNDIRNAPIKYDHRANMWFRSACSRACILTFCVVLVSAILPMASADCHEYEKSLEEREEMANIVLTGTVKKVMPNGKAAMYKSEIEVKRVFKGNGVVNQVAKILIDPIRNHKMVMVDGFGDPHICDSSVRVADTKIFLLNKAYNGELKLNSSILPITLNNLDYTEAVVKTLKKAFQVWSEPSQLTLTYDPVNPDIRVSFWHREHGDGHSNAFDGRGGLLAHAFPPGDLDLSGDIHFDSDETWSVGQTSSRSSKDLLMVAMHEVGHAIGLSHSRKAKDIMYPVYGSYTPDPFLSRHDVKRLRRLYGRNPAFKWVPPPAKIVPQSSVRRVTPRWCRMPFNDVIRGPYGRGYIFSKRYVYRLGNNGVEQGYPLHVRQEFPGAPINPLAVVHVREGTLTFFFKGKRLWRFTNYNLDEGYPKVMIPPFPEKPRAALNIRDRKGHSTVYIFGSRFFWQWNYQTEQVSSSFLFISTFWPALPSKVDAAVHWSDSYIYFFKNNKYYKFSKDSHKLQRGYPQIKGAAWLRGDCGKKPN